MSFGNGIMFITEIKQLTVARRTRLYYILCVIEYFFRPLD